MKIDERTQPIPLKAYKSFAGGRSEAGRQERMPRSGDTSDKVDLSIHSRRVQQAAGDLKQMPDVRRELVAKVKSAVEDGTYRIEPQKVARAMLKEGFENQIIMRKIDVMA